VADALRWLADELRLSQVSGRSPVCLQVLTPLAAGADQIVADAVMQLGVAGTTLVVPVPSDEASYKDSVARDDPEAAGHYEDLRSGAAVVTLAGTAAGNPPYRKLGEWVVDHCDVLLALWDGEPPSPAGPDGAPQPGTAAITSYALSHQREIPVIVLPTARADRSYGADQQLPPPQLLLRTEHANPFLSLWVRVSRSHGSEPLGLSPRPAGLPGPLASPGEDDLADELRWSVRSWKLDAGGGRALRRSIVGSAAREVRRFSAHAGPKRSGSFSETARRGLDGAGTGGTAGAAAVVVQAATQAEDWAWARYLRADWLASRYQQAFRRLDQLVYGLAAASVLLAGARTIWARPGSVAAWFLTCLDVAILGAVSAILIADVRGRLRGRWLSFRAMAEYLRMHMFLAVIYPRVKAEPLSLTPLALNEFVGPAWFGSATLALWWHRPQAQRPWSDADVPLLKTVLGEWVSGQRRYHEATARRHARLDRWFSAVAVSLFIVTVVGAVLHLLLAGAGMDDGLNFVAVGVPGVAAAVTSIATSAEHQRHSVRHRSSVYQLTSRYLPAIARVATLSELRTAAGSLGSFMVTEATEWYSVLAAHSDEIPA
jgi:hypothetical protein